MAKPEDFIGPINWDETRCECENLCKYEHTCIICTYVYFECRIICADPKTFDCPVKESEPTWEHRNFWGLQCNVCKPCCKKYSITGPLKMGSKLCASCFFALDNDEIVFVEIKLNPKVFQFDGFFYDICLSPPRHCIVCMECCEKYALYYEKNGMLQEDKVQR